MILAKRYQVIKPLAQGGFGKTFLACDRYLPGQPQCVIKQFLPQNITAETLKTAQRLFELEAKTLYQVGTHPQIPALLAHFEQDGEFYLVQEYIPGRSLADELAQQFDGPQTRENYTKRLLRGLLTVLAFVHQHNIIHRDIKPANLIRHRSTQQLVLIDFGAIKVIDTHSAVLTVAIGSAGYIAPEQQAGRPCFASDLYAVGMIALCALTGQTPQQLPKDDLTGQIKLLLEESKLSSLAAFVKQLIHPNPSGRFVDAATALATLKSFDQTLLTAPTPAETTLSPPTAFPPTALPSSDIADDLSVQKQAFSVLHSQLTPAQSRNRQALLSKVHRFWIQGVLEQSLHGQVLLTLGLEERQDALALPWNISWESADCAPQPLDAETRVFDVFQQLGEGRSLLILGEPGAGKTTTLLTLTRDLLNHTTEQQRIPAVFNLSSWTGGSIAEWLIVELNSKYQIPKNIGTTWVEEQQLLFLLDGLDEVRPGRQESCAIALNQFHQNYGPEIVVCCRIKDYEALNQKLGFQSAVYVRSLTDAQIWQYIDRADTGLSGLKSLLERSIRSDHNGPAHDEPTLLDLARSPLLLNIMALTYQGVSASQIPTLATAAAQSQTYTHQLFSAYIERMFQRRNMASKEHVPYTKEQTLTWLKSLATNLTNTSQTVFLIERMQVNWLNSKRLRIAYVALLWLSFIVSASLVGSQVVAMRGLPFSVLVGGLICVKIFGLYRIEPAEKLRWSWAKAKRALFLGLTVGPVIGIALKLGAITFYRPDNCIFEGDCLRHSVLLGFSFGIILGSTYGIIRGLSGEKIATVTQPNQGIRQSAKNAVFFAVVATIMPALAGSMLGQTNPFFWAAAGLSFGLAVGGGEACLKHGILRFILFCQGRIPWNYTRFLDYAAERIFLQKVGGGYIFIHRLLLEHFAAMEPNDSERIGTSPAIKPR